MQYHPPNAVPLSHQDQFRILEDMAAMTHGGIPLVDASTHAGGGRKGSQRQRATKLFSNALRQDNDLGDAMIAAGFDTLDARVMQVMSEAGHAEEGFRHLANHHQGIAGRLQRIRSRLAYPVFLLHFGILLLGLPELVAGGGWQSYLAKSLGILLVVYAVAATLWGGWRLLSTAAANSQTAERFLLAIPLLGSLHSMRKASTFLHLLSLQLEAGVNAIEALRRASESSRSALLTAYSRQAAAGFQNGESLATHLSHAPLLTRETRQAFPMAEEIGTLPEIMNSWAVALQERAQRTADHLAFWIPKFVYLAILAYLGYRILALYQRSINQLLAF